LQERLQVRGVGNGSVRGDLSASQYNGVGRGGDADLIEKLLEANNASAFAGSDASATSG